MILKKYSRLFGITGFGAIFLLCLALSTKIHLNENLISMLPDKDPVVKKYSFVIKRFRMVDSLYIDIGTKSGSDRAREEVVRVADALYKRLQQSKMFSTIQYKIDQEKMLKVIQTLQANQSSLFSARDLSLIAQRLKQKKINHYLRKAKRKLMEPSGPFVVEALRQDPLEIIDILTGKFQKLNPQGPKVHIKGGRIWSRDSNHLLMIGVPRFSAVDAINNKKLVTLLNRARQELTQRGTKSPVRISYASGHIATLDNTNTIKRDIWRTMISISIGIGLIGLLFFYHKIFILLLFLPAVFGLGFASGLASIFEPNLSAIALGCGAVLVGITVDYGVHILFHIDGSTAKDHRDKSALRLLVRPLIMGSCTTIAAFLCLTLSSLPGQQQMGKVAALGVLGSVLFAILGLKHFIPPSKKVPGRGILPLNTYCQQFLAWREKHELAVILMGLLILGGSIFGISRVYFEGDVEKLNHLSPKNRADEEQLRFVWDKGSSPTTAVVSGKTLEEGLVANDGLKNELENLYKKGLISSYSSIAPLLPSLKTQRENQKNWNSFWSGKRNIQVRKDFKKALKKLRFTPTAFDPFFETIGRQHSPITKKAFKNSAVDLLIQSRLVSDKSTNVLTTFVIKNRKDLPMVMADLESKVPGVIVMDKKHFVEHTNSLVKTEFKKLLIAASIAMILVLFFFFGRIELVFLAIFPVILSVFVTLGILGIAGIPINLISTLFIIFIFGVGVDFSIFLLNSSLAKYRNDGEFEATTCGSVVICALTTVCGFATLIFSEHPALFSIGITGFIGMLVSLVVSITLVPSFARFLLPWKGRYGTPSFKTLFGAMWAFVYLASLATFYNWFLHYLVMIWHRKNKDSQKRFARRYMHLVAVGLLKCFPYLDSKRIYKNATPDQFKKPAILVSNHLSAFDIMVILSLPVDMVMIVKDWVWKAPFLGQLVRDGGYFLIGSEEPMDLLEKCGQCLKDGISIMFFPEGTRSMDGKMGRFHKGAFEVAINTQSDIIPVLLTNTQACIPRKSFWIGDHQVVIHVLPRITPENYDYNLGSRQLSKYVKSKMAELEHPDWRLAQRGKSFWHNMKSLYNYLGVDIEYYITWKFRLDPIYSHIDDFVPEKGTILDLGCGYGLISNILALKSRSRQVLGVDFDRQKFNIAKRTGLAIGNVEYEFRDLRKGKLPLANGVLMVDVLHYWKKEEQIGMIEKACASLRPGGTLIFRDMCAKKGWSHGITKWLEFFAVGIGHNQRGDDFYFGDGEFYIKTFENCGVKLHSKSEKLGRGSNIVFVFKKENPA